MVSLLHGSVTFGRGLNQFRSLSLSLPIYIYTHNQIYICTNNKIMWRIIRDARSHSIISFVAMHTENSIYQIYNKKSLRLPMENIVVVHFLRGDVLLITFPHISSPSSSRIDLKRTSFLMAVQEQTSDIFDRDVFHRSKPFEGLNVVLEPATMTSEWHFV